MLGGFREAVLSRRSARRFAADKSIPGEILSDLLTLTQRAPSSFNLQPWTCVLVRSRDQRDLMGRAMLSESNKRRVLDAPVTAVFAADLEVAKLLPKMAESLKAAGKDGEAVENALLSAGYYASSGKVLTFIKGIAARAASPLAPFPSPVAAQEWSVKSTMLAAQTYMLAATAHGLATAPMEGFDAARLQAYLDIPDRYSIPLIVPTGYDDDDDDANIATARYPRHQVFFEDSFGNALSSSLSLGEEDDRN